MEGRMEFVTLKALAQELRVNRTTIRRYARAKGICVLQVRTLDSGNQKVDALPVEDADRLRQMRADEGFTGDDQVGPVGAGWFYVIQPVPEYDPQRVKLGFATVVQQRLDTYRTICPRAEVLRVWSCQQAWEHTAMASITREGCAQEGAEVFLCTDIGGLLERADAFFKLMPA
jgi:hypothetical protein